eukprot:s616_g9.t1
MAGASTVCGDCKRWFNTSGAPIGGLCRVSRAIHLLPTDTRITSNNYDLVLSILERSLGEVNTWLSIPLGSPPDSVVSVLPPLDSRGAGEHREDRAGSESRRQKNKRSDRQLERREDRREERREDRQVKPPTPPRSRRIEPVHPEVAHTAAAKRRASPEHRVATRPNAEERVGGKTRKKNKGRKHRERGVKYWQSRVTATNQPHATQTTSGSRQNQATCCSEAFQEAESCGSSGSQS